MSRSRPAEHRSRIEEVRAHLLAGLHTGRLKPGDRLPSVRGMAAIVGADPKTVHRAYLALAREGIVDLRAGSGTFLSEGGADTPRPVKTGDLLSGLNRARAEAVRLGLEPEVFARFLKRALDGGLRGVRLAVVECNLEQVALFSFELDRLLGVNCRHALLPDVAARPRKVLEGCAGIVTTDFHRSELVAIASPLGLPVYRVALDPGFSRALVDEARNGPVVMVVLDRSFAPAFFRFLAESSVPGEVLERFTVVEPHEARSAFRKARGQGTVYISPAVEERLPGRVPDGFRRLTVRHHVSLSSVERLRVHLALDLALRERHLGV